MINVEVYAACTLSDGKHKNNINNDSVTTSRASPHRVIGVEYSVSYIPCVGSPFCDFSDVSCHVWSVCAW